MHIALLPCHHHRLNQIRAIYTYFLAKAYCTCAAGVRVCVGVFAFLCTVCVCTTFSYGIRTGKRDRERKIMLIFILTREILPQYIWTFDVAHFPLSLSLAVSIPIWIYSTLTVCLCSVHSNLIVVVGIIVVAVARFTRLFVAFIVHRSVEMLLQLAARRRDCISAQYKSSFSTH